MKLPDPAEFTCLLPACGSSRRSLALSDIGRTLKRSTGEKDHNMRYTKISAIVAVFVSLMSVAAYSETNMAKLNLMPWPAKIEMTGGKYMLNQNFKVEVTGKPTDRLYRAASRMLRRLSQRTGLFFSQDYLSADSSVQNPGMVIRAGRRGRLRLYMDESYRLDVTPSHILLKANTDIGALRGMQTFLQLLEADSSGYYFPCVRIEDHPRFPWRGLMIDAARHFMPVNVIERNIRGMAAVKLNVLHWHLSDDQGFRTESKTFPKLTGMGSDGLFYTQQQIKAVIRYAADRGIRVVPEFDVPAHSTSWFVGYPQYASAPGPYSIERKWGIFNAVFNPTLNKTYVFLGKFFKEMAGLFPDKYMDVGGDENNGKDWNANPEIQAFMKAHKIPSDAALQTYFENRLVPLIMKDHKDVMGWEEILNPRLPKSAIVQSWRGNESLEKAVKQGYRVILSKGWYLDHYFTAEQYYLVDPVPDSGLTAQQKKLIIGGEACMWSEYVTPENVDSRIWPRAAAIAERLWSPRDIRNVRDMYRRLDAVSLELDRLGLTQIKNQGTMLRNLAGGFDVAPPRTLVNVVAPFNIYERVQAKPYSSFAPLTRVVDAAVPDPKVARDFSFMVKRILAEKEKAGDTVDMVGRELVRWKENDARLEKIIDRSPILREIRPISRNLSAIASIGIDALNYITHSTKASPNWVKANLAKIGTDSAPCAEVELMVVSPIESLVRYAGER